MSPVSILTEAYNYPSKLEGVSRSDEGVCVPNVETLYHGVSEGICGERDFEV